MTGSVQCPYCLKYTPRPCGSMEQSAACMLSAHDAPRNKAWHKPVDPWHDAPPWAIALRNELARHFTHLTETIMPLIDIVGDLEAQAAANGNAEDAIVNLLHKLSEQIAATVGPSSDQATIGRIQMVAQTLKDRAARLAAAVVQNTPADPNTQPDTPPPQPVAVDPTQPQDPQAPPPSANLGLGTSGNFGAASRSTRR